MVVVLTITIPKELKTSPCWDRLKRLVCDQVAKEFSFYFGSFPLCHVGFKTSKPAEGIISICSDGGDSLQMMHQ